MSCICPLDEKCHYTAVFRIRSHISVLSGRSLKRYIVPGTLELPRADVKIFANYKLLPAVLYNAFLPIHLS